MQDNQYFTIGALFKEVLERIQEYAAAFPPLRCSGIRFVISDPEQLWDPPWLRSWSGNAYCISRWERDEPLFLINAREGADMCRLRMRCLDPRIQGWFEDLLDWLVPDWTAPDPQPLAEILSARVRPAASENDAQSMAVAQTSVAGSSSAEDEAEKKPRRGRPPFPEDYKKKQVEDYWKVRGPDSQQRFCKGKLFGERTLRRWINWYVKEWGEPG